jgi:transcriptional regulator with XRE-family HTH domain
MNFIENIQIEMKKRNITAYKLCKDIGLSQQTFSNWKNGKVPALDTAVIIIKYLGISADEIFEIKTETDNYTEKDKQLIRAYHAADQKQQQIIDMVLDLKQDPEQDQGKSSASQPGEEAV